MGFDTNAPFFLKYLQINHLFETIDKYTPYFKFLQIYHVLYYLQLFPGLLNYLYNTLTFLKLHIGVVYSNINL